MKPYKLSPTSNSTSPLSVSRHFVVRNMGMQRLRLLHDSRACITMQRFFSEMAGIAKRTGNSHGANVRGNGLESMFLIIERIFMHSHSNLAAIMHVHSTAFANLCANPICSEICCNLLRCLWVTWLSAYRGLPPLSETSQKVQWFGTAVANSCQAPVTFSNHLDAPSGKPLTFFPKQCAENSILPNFTIVERALFLHFIKLLRRMSLVFLIGEFAQNSRVTFH